MKLVTKEAIKDLAGKAVKDGEKNFTVGKALSNILLNAKVGGKMKLFILAQKCFQEETLEIDNADLNIIKEAVDAHTDQYNNLVTGQLAVYLDTIKE
jgi:hypothetical protein